jgi:hypothetical protein
MVDKLYSYLQNAFLLRPILPGVLAQLKMLKALHEENIHFNTRMTDVEAG